MLRSATTIVLGAAAVAALPTARLHAGEAAAQPKSNTSLATMSDVGNTEDLSVLRLGGADPMASKNDVKSIVGDDVVMGWCRQLCNGDHLDGWYVHDSTDPFKDQYPARAYIHADVASTKWTGLEHPKVVTAETKVNCDNRKNSDSDYQCTPGISLTVGYSTSHSTTTTLGLSQSYTVEVEVPKVFKASSETTFSVSTSSTDVVTKNHLTTTTSGALVTVKPGEVKCAGVEQTNLEYSSTFEIPMQITGTFRCDFGERCGGHYFWFGSFDDHAAESQKMLTGEAQANVASVGTMQAADGFCPGQTPPSSPPAASTSPSQPSPSLPPFSPPSGPQCAPKGADPFEPKYDTHCCNLLEKTKIKEWENGKWIERFRCETKKGADGSPSGSTIRR